MYRYDEFDAEFVRQRVAQFRDQVDRRVSGELTEDEFKPLRLMNGVYLQLHAYMLRIAVPYGTLSSRQMRKLAHIARRYDRGTGHFTTRQNLQFNWPKLSDIPAILDELAQVEMHAIQTSGNCIRNVTADHFAGATADEVADPRPYAEIVRQWSSLHPEFSFLPRKFKVAVIASDHDRAAMQLHDIGLHLKRLADGRLGFAVYVGGGMGRTPFIAKKIRDELPEEDLLSYLEAILRVYNLQGRRDNKYKARIKILVHEIGAEAFSAQVEEEWQRIRDGALKLPEAEIRRIDAYFAPPAFDKRPAKVALRAPDRPFDRWVTRNTHTHRQPGYAIVTISLKPIGGIPGDASADQMDAVADLAEKYSFDEVRVTHEQNLVLPHVRIEDLRAVYDSLNVHRPCGIQRRSRHRHHCLPRPRLLRARQCAFDPYRPAHLGAAGPAPGPDRRPEDQDFRAASMPAAITTSATSASWAWRSAARSTTSSCLAAPVRRTRRWPRSRVRASVPTASSLPSRRSSTPT